MPTERCPKCQHYVESTSAICWRCDPDLWRAPQYVDRYQVGDRVMIEETPWLPRRGCREVVV